MFKNMIHDERKKYLIEKLKLSNYIKYYNLSLLFIKSKTIYLKNNSIIIFFFFYKFIDNEYKIISDNTTSRSNFSVKS